MLQDIIILPTYPPHYKFARTFLSQYFSLVVEEEQVPLYVIFSNVSDMASFYEGSDPVWRDKYHPFMSQNTLTLPNKFLVQCYKKLYALQHLSYRRALIVDSDTEILKPFSAKQMLADDVNSSVIYRHKNYHRFDANVIRQTRDFFGFDTKEPAMYFEQPWIIVKEWITDFYGWWLKGRTLFDVMGSMRTNINVFEIIGYYEFLVKFKSDHIVIKDSDDIMAKHGVDVKKGQGFINFNYIYQFTKHYPTELLAKIVKEVGIVMICGNDSFVENMMNLNPDICIRLHVDRGM